MKQLKQKRNVLRTQASKFITDMDTMLASEVFEDEVMHTFLGRMESLQLLLREVQDAIEPSVSMEEAESEFSRAFEYNDRIVTYVSSHCVSRLKFHLEKRRNVPRAPAPVESWRLQRAEPQS